MPFFKTSRDLQRRLNPADEEAQREPGKRITSRETG
ncbi:hypothetical protein J2861_004989 [Agrobacterium tumefaciens]|nr:hypothetical protein [Agrobacterium tumefaciens]